MIAPAPIQPPRPIGALLRDWRQRRRLSQLDLALEAEISTRHLSFLETGRARPSREMILRLAEPLDIPLRDRNTLLLAAGFAPLYAERALDDPLLAAARIAVDRVLAGHEPFPAIAVGRHWNLLAANRVVPPLLSGASPELLAAPVNVLRLSLHPRGLAPRIANLGQWRAHLLARLRRQAESTADPTLAALVEELSAYPLTTTEVDLSPEEIELAGIATPLRLRTRWGLLSFFSIITVFGAPHDVTLADLAIEAFFPANPKTADALRDLHESIVDSR